MECDQAQSGQGAHGDGRGEVLLVGEGEREDIGEHWHGGAQDERGDHRGEQERGARDVCLGVDHRSVSR